MSDNALAGEARTGTGKGVARKLRAAGRIPAVVYGRGEAVRSITVESKALNTVLHKSGAGMNTLIDLQVEGQNDTVLLKALQRDPVQGSYLHADFYLVDLSQKVEVQVPLHFVGKAAGLEMGGLLDHPLRELLIECLPAEIPESIDVDVSALELGDSIHVSEVALPEGAVVKTEPTLTVATVVAPKAAEEEEAAEEVVVEGEAPEAAAPEAAGAEAGGEGGGDS